MPPAIHGEGYGMGPRVKPEDDDGGAAGASPNISPNQVHRGRESAKSCCAAIT